MKRDFEGTDLLELGGVMKQGYAYIAANAGKIIALLTVIVAALVTFTDIAFSELAGATFTSSLIIMLIASYLMYFSMEDAGEKLGEESEDHIAARKRYLAAREKVRAEDMKAFREFCCRYASEEAEYRKRGYLASLGYCEEDYAAYKDGAEVSARERRIFRKCDAIRPARLTPALLLSLGKRGSKSELTSPEPRKIISILIRLIPTTVGTFFTVSVMLTAKSGLTASTVIEGILKLSALPIIGFKGCQAGYLYSRNEKSAWLETKARIIEAFLSEKI